MIFALAAILIQASLQWAVRPAKDAFRRRLVLFQSSEQESSVDKFGNWEEIEGNYVLKPSRTQPRGIVHFLGGALVGAVPCVSYRYLLERLADEGYLIVATPFNVSLDHLQVCDSVIERFDVTRASLAQTYEKTCKTIPVIGLGHSYGALLHVLITSLFPDTTRAANALISYNCKPVQDVIPMFEEVVVPFCAFVRGIKRGGSNDGPVNTSEIRSLGVHLVETLSQGRLPFDNDLSKMWQQLELPRNDLDESLQQAFQQLVEPLASAFNKFGGVPLVQHIFYSIKDFLGLISSITSGTHESYPSPHHVLLAVRSSYKAPRTLLIQYAGDSLDETDKIEVALQQASNIVEVQVKELSGTHATPLLSTPMNPATLLELIVGQNITRSGQQFVPVEETASELIQWMEGVMV